ncbi:hypothetical protein V5O48_007102 [Marasmius crinis-equi]|uniref:F-box domain-containing protein n=1 Tax=Marasmius crinis-equi TaxID=585013 RepID=A0ABR3FHL7_9AGAR
MPAEVLSRIAKFLGDPTDLHRLLHVNRRMFKIATPFRYASIHIDMYLTLHRAALMYSSGDPVRRDIYRSAPRKVMLGARSDTPQWEFQRTFELLGTLTAVKSLYIWHLPHLPYGAFAGWISSMSTLDTVEIISSTTQDFMPRYYTPKLPITFPSLTRLHLVDFRWKFIQGNLDQSISSLAHLSSLPSLTSFCVDVRSWTAMARGRWCERLSFPSSVKEIEIIAGPDCTRNDLEDEAWARGIYRALPACADALEKLRVELPYETRAVLETPIRLPRLKVFVGPEGLQRSLILEGPLTVLWVTTSAVVDIARWDSIWPTLGNPSLLHMLRVGSWDTRSLGVAEVLSALPALEELSIFTKTELTKVEFPSSYPLFNLY